MAPAKKAGHVQCLFLESYKPFTDGSYKNSTQEVNKVFGESSIKRGITYPVGVVKTPISDTE